MRQPPGPPPPRTRSWGIRVGGASPQANPAPLSQQHLERPQRELRGQHRIHASSPRRPQRTQVNRGSRAAREPVVRPRPPSPLGGVYRHPLTAPSHFYSEVVEALLRSEAVTNTADNKGCYPLHLAAWKGDEHIVRLLIHQGPSHPRLNEQVGRRRRAYARSHPGPKAMSSPHQ